MRIKKTSQYIEGGASLSNVYGTSQSNGYTQEYINGLETYSTTEKRVGTWIDGKPVYRKTITGNTSSNEIYISLINNVDVIIKEEGHISYPGGTYEPINTIYNIASNYFTRTSLNNASHIEYFYYSSNLYNRPYYITLEYTKTTDTTQNTRSIPSNDEVEEEDNR